MTQVQVDKNTGEILATGDFPAGSPDPKHIAIADLRSDQLHKLGTPGKKVLQGDGTITITAPPPIPEPDTPPAQILSLIAMDADFDDDMRGVILGILALLGGQVE